MKKFKEFVSEKMEKVEDFCNDHFCSIAMANLVGFCGIMVLVYNRYCKNISNRFKDLN